MNIRFAGTATVLLLIAGLAEADELTQTKAEQLLTPAMTHDCGTYYTEQGDPAFAEIDGKPMCNYVPRITSFSASGETAKADFNRDRYFDDAMSQTWLKDYAVMESKGTPGIIYKALKKNLDKWRAESSGVDKAARPGHATFKLEGGEWKIASISID